MRLKTVATFALLLAVTPISAIAQSKGGLKPPSSPVAPSPPGPSPPTTPSKSLPAPRPTGIAGAQAQLADASFSTKQAFELLAQKTRRSNERLAPQLRVVLDPNGMESPSTQKAMTACVAGESPNVDCLNNVLQSVRGKRNAVAKSGVDVAVEAARVRQELGEPADDPGTAKAPPDLAVVTESSTTADAAPLGNVAQTIPLPLELRGVEGAGARFDRVNRWAQQNCTSAEFGACYKRIAVGGSFPVPKGMRRGLVRATMTFSGSVAAISLLAYSSAEVKISLYVGGGRVPTCSVSKSLAHIVAPVFGGGIRNFSSRPVLLACPFPIDPSFTGDQSYAIVIENWSGTGGLGAVASASAFTAIDHAVVDLSPTE